MRQYFLLAFAGAVACGIGFGYSSGFGVSRGEMFSHDFSGARIQESPEFLTANNYDYAGEKQRLETLFAAQGSKTAYAYFQRAYQNIDPAIVHNLAHWIGNELYRREDIQGVSLCDASYQFGCFHGFFGAALGTRGTEILPKVEEVCMKSGGVPAQFGGCIHGVGHGLLGLRGYRANDLIGALKDCDILISRSSQEGCYNGVFMEYNIRTMQELKGNKIIMRAFDAKRPFDPCDTLTVAYQPFCFYEQPAWWTTVGEQSISASGILCASLNNVRNRDECFRGLGRAMLGNSDNNAQQIISQCAKMPDGESSAACVRESVRLLLSQGNTASWKELCQSISGADASLCMDEAKTFLCSSFSQCN